MTQEQVAARGGTAARRPASAALLVVAALVPIAAVAVARARLATGPYTGLVPAAPGPVTLPAIGGV